jgi:hypothetical protein
MQTVFSTIILESNIQWNDAFGWPHICFRLAELAIWFSGSWLN